MGGESPDKMEVMLYMKKMEEDTPLLSTGVKK